MQNIFLTSKIGKKKKKLAQKHVVAPNRDKAENNVFMKKTLKAWDTTSSREAINSRESASSSVTIFRYDLAFTDRFRSGNNLREKTQYKTAQKPPRLFCAGSSDSWIFLIRFDLVFFSQNICLHLL